MASNRHTRIRVANAELAAHARLYGWDRDTAIPFLCECDNDNCQSHVRISLEEYGALTEHGYIAAEGHVAAVQRAA